MREWGTRAPGAGVTKHRDEKSARAMLQSTSPVLGPMEGREVVHREVTDWTTEAAGRVTITRNAAGHLVIEGRRSDGSAHGFSTYAEGSHDFYRALDQMVAGCLPSPEVACKRCGGPAAGRAMVAVQSGGAMHRNPCWSTALDEAVQDA